MKKKLKLMTAGMVLAAVTVCLPAFGAKTITVKGSDTILVLGQMWAEEYMKLNPGISIQVTGGGSGVGLAALVDGTTDIANASRKIKEKEVDKAKLAGYYPEEFKIALDSLAIVVNKDNPVTELSLKQIMGIYLGRINNWSEVGGSSAPIIRYSRESSSGTYQFIKEFVLKNGDFAADSQTMQGTSAVANAVGNDLGGIGYGGAAYFIKDSNVKILGVKKDDKSTAVYPAKDGQVDYEAAWSGTYPIWRYLYMYTPVKPRGDIKAYIQWCLSDAGQKIVEQAGYVPLKK